MKKLNLVLIAGMMCFLTGCPYTSDQPAEKSPAAGLNPALPGRWLACNPEEKRECVSLSIYRFNGTEYYAETSEIDYKGDGSEIVMKTDRYRLFPTAIGSPALLNLQELSLSTSAAAGNSFLRIESPNPDELAVSYVTDNFVKEKFKSSRELSEYLKANLEKPDFFESFATFTRIKK